MESNSSTRLLSYRLFQMVDVAFMIIFIAILGWIALTALSSVQIGGNRDQNRTALGELIQDVIVQQEVPVKEIVLADTLCYDVFFATYKRVNPSILKMSLIQGDFRRSIRLDASELTDNRFFPLCFQANGFSTGKAILEIAGLNGRPGLSPTVWMTSDISFGEAVHNGNLIKKSLIFQAYAKRHLGFFSGLIGIIVPFCIIFISVVVIRNPLFRDIVSARFIRVKESGFCKFCKTLTDYQRSVFIFSVVAWTLSLVMATISQFAAHPDEALHSVSAAYYENHNLPPEVGDPKAEPTYAPTRYGVSYINNSGIDYFLIGKFSSIIKSIVRPLDYIVHRWFNLFLFFILCIMMWHSEKRLIYFPIIITPQVWYIASYTNNDFFPFFIMMLLCSELLDNRSFYNRFLRRGQSLFFAFPSGVLLGILLISKSNYLVFVLFSGWYLVWNVMKLNQFQLNKNLFYSPAFKSLLIIVLCAVSVYSVRTGFDIYQNGFDKKEKLKHYANQFAAKGFRPVDIESNIQQTPSGLRLKEKGESLENLLVKKGWKTLSINSFFGVYGWMTIKAPEPYFQRMTFFFCLLMAYAGIQSGLTFQAKNIIFLMVSFFFMCLMVFASLYHSWTYDFQPQGRYLFPILGILSVLFHEMREHLNRHILGLLIVMMFAFSFWSFLFVGIYQIKKMV